MSAAQISFEMVVFLIVLALAFDFMNGFHDAANSIATVVSTRVLRPQVAVAWAAFFNFVAFLVFGLSVANTIGTGVIEPAIEAIESAPFLSEGQKREILFENAARFLRLTPEEVAHMTGARR